jgi:16S rRNA (guanine966-N2)-methyltransferase
VRVVAGAYKGQRLTAPRGATTRPTQDRVREALFSVLGTVEGERVLDLYAGSGALGIEALSRGAAHATLVESDAKAVQVIERNAADLGCADRCLLLRQDVERALPRLPGPYDLVFSDPPYALRRAQKTLDVLASADLVSPGSRVILERDRREPQPVPPDGFDLEDEHRYGDTLVLIIHRR